MKNNLLKSIFISLILLMGVGNAWGYGLAASQYVYFEKPADWSNVSLLLGHNSYSIGYNMTKISNTNLYYWKTDKWDGYTRYCFIDATGWGGEGKKPDDRKGYASHSTNVFTNQLIKYHLFTTAGSKSSNASFYATAVNRTQTIKAQIKNGSNWEDATIVPADLTASTYALTSATAADAKSASLAKESTTFSATVSAAYSAKVTLSCTNVLDGYVFEGWYDANGNKITSYTVSNVHTVYARFTIKQHTVSYGVCSTTHWGSIQLNSETAITTTGTKTLNYGTSISFTAKPNAGYQVEGWYSNSDCTSKITAAGTSTTYDAGTLTADKTIYVKFEQIPATSKTITYTEEGTGWTYGASNPTSAEEGATVTFVVNPTAGYSVSVSSDGPALTKNGNNYTFTMPGKDVKINVEAKGEQYTITLNDNGGSGGSGTVTATYLAPMPSVTPPTRTGYTFIGYFDATSGGTKYYDANGSSAKNWDKTSNTTLYAQWTINQYTITYKDQNNATFSGKHASGYPTTHTYGTATTLKDPTKTGYTFDGWFTTSACTGTAVTSLGATDYTSDITLYAKWTELPPTTVYFKPINDWKGDNVRFAVYYWKGNTNGWVNMTPVDCGGTYYSANILNGFTNIKFVSFPTDKENNWAYDINGTEDLTIPTDGKVLYDMASTNITHIYLQPDNNWKQGNAAFQAYFWGNTQYWEDMTSHGDGIYVCENKAQANILFYRQNPNNGYDKWTQTEDLKVPTNGKNLFVINQNSSTDLNTKSKGTWSTIYDNSKWTTFTEPTFDVIVHINGRGSIEINGTTYKGDSRATTNRTITSIAANATLSVGAITPNEHWTFDNAQIQIGSNEQETLNANSTTDPICGDAEIYVNFTTDKWEVTFNINPPKGVIYPEDWTPNQWQYVENNGIVTEPTVKEIDGYIFGGWYTNNSTFSESNAYDFATKVTDHKTLYARWARYEECIFFKNNLDWGEVYVYTFSDAGNPWWGDQTGVHPGTASLEKGKKMTRMGQSDIYYYVMNKESSNYTQESNANRNYIAFSNKDMSSYGAFYDAEAVFRGDHKKNLTLFVPLIKEEQKPEEEGVKPEQKMKYYNKGLWMKYNSTESGYQMATDDNFPGLGTDDNKGWSTYGNKFEAETPGGYTFSITKHLDANKTYEFKLKNYVWVKDWENNDKNQWFAYNGTITQDKCTNLNFIYEESQATQYGNTKITTTTAGEYTFHIYLGDGKVVLSVDYPLSVGDYQLWYTDETYANDEHHKEERIIKKCNEGSRLDTISFFVRKDKKPKVNIQKCYNITGATKEWTHVVTLDNITVDATSVYNFVIKQTNEGGNHEANFTGDYFLHEGDFYIRTDMAPGGWNSYKQTSHAFTHFNKYEDETYNHYWVQYTNNNTNVKARIATDYSMSLSTELNDYYISNANVRFSYNNETNEFDRAFLGGSSNNADFLRLVINNAGFSTGITFGDISNWVYEVTTKVTKGQIADVRAKHGNFDSGNPYILRDDVKLLGDSSSTGQQTIRVIYDFKKNRMICGWLPGDITLNNNDTLVIDADMLIVRVDNDTAPVIDMKTASNKISELNRLYFVLELNKTTVIDDSTNMFWFSLPFDCKLKDVFGIEGYGTKWVVQRYRGDKRAELGFRPEIETFWANMKQSNTATLEANRGYVLSLNLTGSDFKSIDIDEKGDGNKVTKSLLRLYFPSTAQGFTLSKDNDMIVTVPEHLCTVQSIEDRKPLDSHWNIIGVPGYQPVKVEGYKPIPPAGGYYPGEDANKANLAPNFLYTWNGTKDDYTVEDGSKFTYQHFYAYMVQFAGTINWAQYTSSTPNPSTAPRRTAPKADKRYKVVLGEDGANMDQTFITLSEKGTHEYSIGNDLEKIGSTSVARIYTQEGNWNLAANHLSDTTTVLPLTLSIPAEGEYTLSLEQGRYSSDALLYDSENGTYTDLSKEGYTFTAEAGVNNERFALRFGMKLPGGNPTDLQQAQTQYLVRTEGQRIIIEGMAGNVRLYDMTGRLMLQQHATEYTELTAPATGVYVLQVGDQFEKMILK